MFDNTNLNPMCAIYLHSKNIFVFLKNNFKTLYNKVFRSFAAKTILATKARSQEAEKMLRIFPLCLSGLVAKFFFCKKK